MTPYEIRYDDDGKLDELVGRGHVPLERMDEGAWCLILDCDDGSQVNISLSTEIGRAHV